MEELLEENFFFNSEEIYNIFLSLDFKISKKEINKFFVSKENGQSFSYIFQTCRKILILYLIKEFFSLIFEEVLKKNTFFPRIHRYTNEFLLRLREKLNTSNKSLVFVSKIEILLKNRKRTKKWFLKNFPYKKLNFFNIIFENYSSKIPMKFHKCLNSLYYLFLNFVLHRINKIQLFSKNLNIYQKIEMFNSISFMKNKNFVYVVTKNINFYKFFFTLLRNFFLIRGINFKKDIVREFNLDQTEININRYNLIKKSKSFVFKQSKNYIKEYKVKIKTIIKKSKKNFLNLIKILNKEIRIWKNYNFFLENFMNLTKTLDIYINRVLWKYVKHLHTRRKNTWIYNKYWKLIANNWRFIYVDHATGKIEILLSHKNFIQYYHTIRIPTITNFFKIIDFKKIAYINFLKWRYMLNGIKSLIFNRQKGFCYKCNFPLYEKKTKILNYKRKNLILVHSTCNF